MRRISACSRSGGRADQFLVVLWSVNVHGYKWIVDVYVGEMFLMPVLHFARI